MVPLLGAPFILPAAGLAYAGFYGIIALDSYYTLIKKLYH